MILTWNGQHPTPDNADVLRTIEFWWTNLDGVELVWQQRLFPTSGQIDWQPQCFDETFICCARVL